MVYAWSQTPRSIGSKKTCSTWPSDSSLSSRNRGRNTWRAVGRVIASREGAVYLDTEVNLLDFRFKPVQKFDTCSGENYSSGGQSHPGAAEQTVIAQSQHHQQFLGLLCFCAEMYCRIICFQDCDFFIHFLLFSPTDATRALPDFVDLDLGQSNTENISPDDVKALQSLYREHCEVRGSPFSSCALQSCNSYDMKKGSQLLWSGASFVLIKTRYNS